MNNMNHDRPCESMDVKPNYRFPDPKWCKASMYLKGNLKLQDIFTKKAFVKLKENYKDKKDISYYRLLASLQKVEFQNNHKSKKIALRGIKNKRSGCTLI